MKIAIWTECPPKISAIESAVEECIYFKWHTVDLISKKVDSWISDMAKNIIDTMVWSKNRAHNIAKITEADFYVWMEWWTTKIWDKIYLIWVAYILNNEWEWHYWISNMMEIPEIFAQRVYEKWEDFWKLLAEITWEEWTLDKDWAIW